MKRLINFLINIKEVSPFVRSPTAEKLRAAASTFSCVCVGV